MAETHDSLETVASYVEMTTQQVGQMATAAFPVVFPLSGRKRSWNRASKTSSRISLLAGVLRVFDGALGLAVLASHLDLGACKNFANMHIAW